MWPYPKIIAHRGGGSLAPENTLAAVRCGLDSGFHAIEFDVMLARDGVPIIMHDPQLGRTVVGAGDVNQHDAAQLMQMDAGAWFAPRFQGEPIPTLEQVITFCIEHQIWMNIEIKPAPGTEVQTGAMAACVTDQVWQRQSALRPIGSADLIAPLFSSFSFEALLAAKKQAPHIARGFLMDRVGPDWQQRLAELEAVALHTNHKHLDQAQAQNVKQAGYGLMCYTVNQPERAREILGWGVDAFCTDRIDLIGPDFR